MQQYLANSFAAELANSFWPDPGTLRNPTKHVYIPGQSSQANAQDIQQSTSRPNAHKELSDPLFVTPGASLSASSLKRRIEEDDGNAANGQDTAETSGAEYSSHVRLPRPQKNKPSLSSRGRRAQAMHRANGRVRGDGRKLNRFKRRRLPQAADSESESTWDNSDEDYSPLHMKAAQPQHKHSKVFSHLRRVTVPSPVRRTRECLASSDSSRPPAAKLGQARYEESPVHKASLNGVMDAGTAQHQFHRDLLHHYQKRYATSPLDWEESETRAQDTIGSEEELYDVEEILDWAWDDDTQQMEYLIKWEGYDSSENTWEPLINLTQCQAQLAQFHCRCESAGPGDPEE